MINSTLKICPRCDGSRLHTDVPGVGWVCDACSDANYPTDTTRMVFREVSTKDYSIETPDKLFVNEHYQVAVRNLSGEWTWLSIKRKDKESMHDWREFQRIKNAICGEEREAVELYPAESRLVDSSNQFHLFVMPEGERFPFGYGERLVVQGHEGKSKQRPFDPSQLPKDALTEKEMHELVKKRTEAKRHDGHKSNE